MSLELVSSLCVHNLPHVSFFSIGEKIQRVLLTNVSYVHCEFLCSVKMELLFQHVYIFLNVLKLLWLSRTHPAAVTFRFKPPGMLEKKKEWQVILYSETKEH